jgi:hypothetical protein
MNPPNYDWFVKHHQDSGSVMVAADIAKFKHLVRQRAEAVGRTDVSTLIGQALYRALYEPDRYGAVTTILDAIQPALSAPDGRPFHGPWDCEGRTLRDTSGPSCLAGVSAFWCARAMQADEGRLDRFAEWATGAGLSYVRWFGSHDWAGGTDVQMPNYFSLMERTIEGLSARGLRSAITLFTRRHLISEPHFFSREWADLVSSHREEVVWVEIANESRHPHNDWSDEEVRSCADVIRERSDTPLALSAAAAANWDDMEEQLRHLYTSSDSADVTTVHFPRRDDTGEGAWRWVRQPWKTKDGTPGCPRVVIDNEHQRWDRSAGGRDVGVAVSSVVTAFVCGCAASAHHDVYGVVDNAGEYGSCDELRRVFAAVLPNLPDDLPSWETVRVGEGGGPHPFPALLHQHWTYPDEALEGSGDTGVSRAYAAINGNRFVMALTGVRVGVTLWDDPGVPYRVISCSTGETVHEGRSPCAIQNETESAYLVCSMDDPS